ncbi:protein of unknown function [Paraburkholderia fungorum]|uniref:DUF4347 domain-containing protein n=1 Tax=Paraburkholderia fungorum TaxID=134537 RepID=A0A1H1H9L5_9BURK|nr:DUF4347 domain-containing protein [Paraburkholderia fungorum]SDR21756.1 protein of unknown function [Paraburkholderia fungorum]
MKIIQQLFKRFDDARNTCNTRDTRVGMRGKSSGVTVKPAPLLMALEPRVVYDASVAAVAPHHHGAEAQTHAGAAASTDATVHAAPKTIAEHDVQHAKPGGDGAARNSKPSTSSDAAGTQSTTQTGTDVAVQKTVQTDAATAAVTDPSAAAAAHAVVFIDPSVTDYQALIAGLPAGTQYVVLNADTDGFAQIAQYLQTHQGIQSIHLISHGSDGEIQAGAAWLNSSNIAEYSGDLAAIGAAMAPGGDFLIYGCDVAEQADGQALVQQVAALTHLNVAASTDLTGSTAVGGDWTLEYQVGDVHTPVLLSAASEQAYDHVLGTTIENYTGVNAVGFSTGDVNGGVSSFTLDGLIYTFKDASGNPININTIVTQDFYLQQLADEGGAGNALQINQDGILGLASVTITRVGNTPFNFQSIDLDIESDTGAQGIVTIVADNNTANAVTLETDNIMTAVTMTLSATNASFADAHSITISGGDLLADFGHLVYADVGPSLTTTSTNATFTAGDNTASTPVAVDAGITLTDSTSATAQSATITISNFKTGDELLYTAMNGISGAYSNGVLTLTGSATIAQWQSALESVTFTNTQITPDATIRTINFSITDVAGVTTTATRNITVVDTDQTPIVSTTGGSTSYVAGAASVTIDSGLSISDSDSTHQAIATVTIGNASTSDILNFTANATLYGNISGTYLSSTHTLTLTGSATDAQWQAALDSIGFSSSVSSPGGARTISFSINDGTKTSAIATKTVAVIGVPVVTTDTGSAAFVAGNNVASTPVAIDSGLTVADGSSGTLASATVQITGNFHAGEDLLLFVNNPATMADITGSYNSGTGLLTLTSASHATLAQWQAALRSITFEDTAVTPNSATRTISFAVNDGSNSSAVATRTVSVTDTDQTPILTTSGGSSAFAAGDNALSTPVVVDSGITVSDLDNTTLASATVSITGNFHAGEDVLSFINVSASTFGNINAAYNASTGMLTLSSAGTTATLAQWQAALRAVTYTDTAVTPNSATRTVSFSVNDGTATSLTVTRTVTIADTDQTPVLSTSGGSASFVAGDNAPATPVAIDSGVTLSDLDNTTLASATASITGNFHAGEDVLMFVNNGVTEGNITGSYNATTGVLTLTSAGATATLAQWQAALQAVTYTDTAVTPNSATRTVSFTVNDGTKTSATVTRTVTVADTDQTPVLGTSGGSTSFVAGDNTTSTPVAVDSGITVSDLDNTTLASATVSITGNFHAGEDVLMFFNNGVTEGNITGSYNAVTGVLTLSSAGATATLAQWQAALRAVTYTDTAITPNSATRTVSFSVDDGIKDSAAGTKTVTVTTTDQTPIVSASTSGANYISGASAQNIDSGLTLSDADNTTLTTATIQFTSGFHNGDLLALNYVAATMGSGFSVSFNGATGTLIVSGGPRTVAQMQAILDGVQFSTSAGAALGTRTLSVTVSDGTSTSAAVSYDIDVVSSAPIVSVSGSSAAFVAGDNTVSTPVAVDSGLTVSDPLTAMLASATVSITGNFHAGEDVLMFVNDGLTDGNITSSYDAATGVLTLTSSGGTATLAQWQAALRSVTYTDTAITPDTATRTISFTADDGTQSSATVTSTVTIADTDQTPILTTSGGDTSFVAGDNSASTPVAIDTGITVSDLDNTTMASATVAITGGFHAGEDVLSFTNYNAANFGNIVASYDAATGVMTLTSTGATATLAQWQNALGSVTYTDTAVTPDTTQRTISFTINDGVKSSAVSTQALDVTATDQTPIVSTTTGDASFASGDNTASTPVAIDTAITVSDLDNTTLASATVAITGGFHAGEDVLSFTNDNSTSFGNITSSYDATTGVMTLTSAGDTATLAQWQAALRSITYTDTAVTPDTTQRTISFTIDDGVKSSAISTKALDMTATDQTPIITTTTGDASFASGDNTASTPVAIDTGITVSDLDNTTLASATVAITSGFHAGEDQLAFTNNNATSFGNITSSYDATTGVMTLTSAGDTATIAQWQAALRSVTYTDTAVTPDTTQRTISFTVNDGVKSSAVSTKAIDLSATTQTPTIVGGTGDTPTFVASGAGAIPVAIDGGISISDADASAHPSSALVSVSGNFQPGHDVLAFTSSAATGNISGSYDATTGVLTLTSAGNTATLAQWQAALAAVTYADTAAEVTSSSRTISFAVAVDGKESGVVTRTVNVAAAPTTVRPPNPATPTTLPPRSPFIGNGSDNGNGSATPVNAPSPFANAPDSIVAFPMNLGDSISNPLIVLDIFVETPDIGSIPAIHTSTFTADNFGDLGASSGAGGGAHRYGSLSQTSVESLQAVSAPQAAPLALDLPNLALHLDIAPNQPFSVSLPVMLGGAEGLPVGTDAHVELRLADGRPLPGWLHYDPVRGTLSGKVPANQGTLAIAIIASDAAGHQTRREVAINFGTTRDSTSHGAVHGATRAPVKATPATHAPHAAVTPAKPSLAEQFARAHASLHVTRPPVAHAATLPSAAETAGRGVA